MRFLSEIFRIRRVLLNWTQFLHHHHCLCDEHPFKARLFAPGVNDIISFNQPSAFQKYNNSKRKSSMLHRWDIFYLCSRESFQMIWNFSNEARAIALLTGSSLDLASQLNLN